MRHVALAAFAILALDFGIAQDSFAAGAGVVSSEAQPVAASSTYYFDGNLTLNGLPTETLSMSASTDGRYGPPSFNEGLGLGNLGNSQVFDFGGGYRVRQDLGFTQQSAMIAGSVMPTPGSTATASVFNYTDVVDEITPTGNVINLINLSLRSAASSTSSGAAGSGAAYSVDDLSIAVAGNEPFVFSDPAGVDGPSYASFYFSSETDPFEVSATLNLDLQEGSSSAYGSSLEVFPVYFSYDVYSNGADLNGQDVLGETGSSFQAIPEPGAWAFMAIGLISAGAALRRRSAVRPEPTEQQSY